MTEPSSPTTCPACGAPAAGTFCSSCGAGLAARACAACNTELSVQARFCHRCGHPVSPRGPASTSPHRAAWITAALLCLVLVGGIVYQVSSAAPRNAPDMANAGAVSARDELAGGDYAGGSPPAVRAPDISGMTPRERFDRLFNRIMQAAERGDSLEVRRFTPMALGAYD